MGREIQNFTWGVPEFEGGSEAEPQRPASADAPPPARTAAEPSREPAPEEPRS